MTDRNRFKAEMAAFEEYLESNFPPKGGFLSEVSRKIIESGGKRLRPAFTILTAMTGEYDREMAFSLAASIETLHTATLVHDDIIDNAKTRRGAPTVSSEHGTSLAVYTGDYLLVKAVSFLSKAEIPPDKIAYVTNGVSSICMGEVDQYHQRYNIPTFYAYLKRIIRKTGILFGAACALGAFCGKLTEAQTRAAVRFGMYYGAAFQIADDLLDLESTQKEIGKPVLNDLKEGIVTLPVLLAALKSGEIREEITALFDGKGDIALLAENIRKSGGAEGARKIKKKYIKKALTQLEILNESESRENLSRLVKNL